MTVAVLVPVKDLSRAKTRLSHLLTGPERAELAGILLQGVLDMVVRADALRASARPGGEPLRRVVVTAHEPSAERARRLGFEVIPEREPVSESGSVDAAAGRLTAEGVRGVLRIPLDLPLIDDRDVGQLLAEIDSGARAILVPSASGDGTNALYRSPPDLFPSRFGPGSLALHREEARRAGVEPRILPLPAFALDVDDPGDLRELLRRDVACPVLTWLRDRDIAGRLDRASVEG